MGRHYIHNGDGMPGGEPVVIARGIAAGRREELFPCGGNHGRESFEDEVGHVCVACRKISSWTASSDSEWVHVTPSSGRGDGSVAYRVQENTNTEERVARLMVAGCPFVVTQAAAEEREPDDPASKIHLIPEQFTVNSSHGPASERPGRIRDLAVRPWHRPRPTGREAEARVGHLREV